MLAEVSAEDAEAKPNPPTVAGFLLPAPDGFRVQFAEVSGAYLLVQMTGKRGAPVGNANGAKNKPWSDVIRRVALRDKKQLEKLARALIDKAASGDLAALREFGDRFEGKVPQAIEGSGLGTTVIVNISGSDRIVL